MFIDTGISHIQKTLTKSKFESLSELDKILVIKRLKQIKASQDRLDRKGIYKRAQHLTTNSPAIKKLGLTYIDLLVLGQEERFFYSILGPDGVLYVSSSRVTDLGDAFFLLYKMNATELTREAYKKSLHRLRTKKYEALKRLQPDIVNAVEREREALKIRWEAQQGENHGDTGSTNGLSTERNGRDSDENQYLDGSD